ncbi:hypothetical protein XA3_18920 [Xylocopilactobacillus apicola]|uniref:RsgI N-terminal anti-sigma domain-containing protein n=1 Tax=Xylocopilactobacillus apicola TaxID=2932184 RepID=A0AAU9D3N9_9LACO|nr:hypothetical protein XA3_18920 [Xylocopilactobacillus apicola]
MVKHLIEISVDYKMIKGKSATFYLGYMNCIARVYSVVVEKRSRADSISSFFVFRNLSRKLNAKSLKIRIDFLCEEYPVKKIHWVVKFILIVIPLIITSIVVEPYYSKTKQTIYSFQFDPNDSATYVSRRGNRYFLIVNGKDAGELKNFLKIKDKNIRNLPIKDE